MKIKAKFVLQVFLLLVFTSLTLSLVSATYIAGEISIQEDGSAKFDVETDVPIEIQGLTFNNEKLTGTTNYLTSKSGISWTFKLDEGNYETILIDINLPKNLDSIISIQGIDTIIDIDNKIITLIDSGKLDFEISYNTKETQSFLWVFWPIAFIIIVIIYFIIKRSKARKDRLAHIMPIISDVEQKIVEILMKGQMRQKELRKKLEVPKASFSRYMANLERKKLILREGDGKNKVVKLK